MFAGILTRYWNHFSEGNYCSCVLVENNKYLMYPYYRGHSRDENTISVNTDFHIAIGDHFTRISQPAADWTFYLRKIHF